VEHHGVGFAKGVDKESENEGVVRRDRGGARVDFMKTGEEKGGVI